MHHFSKWFARKKILFAWFGLKNVLCNPEELVEHVKICNSELSLYRDHFFSTPPFQKVNTCSFW